LGLRTQITFALVTGLGLLVVLVGLTADRFALRTVEGERAEVADTAARAAAEIIGRADAPPILLDRAEAALVGHGSVVGFVVRSTGGEEEHRGLTLAGISREHAIRGGSVRVFVTSSADESARALVRALLLYAVMSALGILILCYALLTRLIVRPIGLLTAAATRLARGHPDARAEPTGAAEIAALATAFNGMARDLASEREALRQQVDELRRTTDELRQKEDSLVRSEKLASVGRLAAGVAHEIGNPLTSILGLVDLLEGGDIPAEEQAEFLKRIHAETDRIHRTIRELLDFARKGPDEDDFLAVTQVSTAVERAVQLVGPQKDMRKVTIERRMPEGDLAVRLHEERLVQVLLNLLMNAADAIDGEGRIVVEVEDDDLVTIRVSDTGPGIAPEVAERLFEPFVTTKPSGQGTGLGLAVCHSIIERAGGTIAAVPSNEGATFSVRLPRG
jgi:signal transduction histidine kinase